jgi:N-acetylglutamate synthase/N-acetylornithine aminotransferase
LTLQEYVDGVAGNLTMDRKLPATDVGVLAMSGVQTYADGDEIDVRVSLDTGTVNLTFWGAGLTLQRVG